MGLFSSFSTALSAMNADSSAINVTGNNLANLNTTGFKGTNVNFRDMVSASMGADPDSQIGLGVATPLNVQVFSQGSITSSTGLLDSAIQGNGFYVVNNAAGQQLFTRDGSFKVGSNGVLQTQTGEHVQGWMATSTGLNPSGPVSDIVIPSGTVLPPQATANLSMQVNLDALSAGGTTFSQPIQVVDSLGGTHTLNMTFTKDQTKANTWAVDVTIPGADVGAAAPASLLTGGPATLKFKADGTLDTTATTTPIKLDSTSLTLADGASPMKINWNLTDANKTALLTQFGQASSASTPTQDGTEAAQLSDVSIGDGGTVVAKFSNGQSKVEGQIAIAAILNPDTMMNVGNNNFEITSLTSAPAIGSPGTGGRGDILGSSLKSSNVDIATQFTKLIVYQRGYEASSKVISTADQMSQDVINLVR